MKFLKLIVCVLFLLTLTACKDAKEEEVTEFTKVEKDTINSDQLLDIVAPSDDEVIALTKNFVTTIFSEAEALGGSDETPITEDQYDELAKALTSVATDDALQGMLKEVLLNLCYACDSNPLPTFYYFSKEDLTFSNDKLDGSNYSVEVSYADEMIDSLVQETMSFYYEDDVWKVQSYTFEFSALQDDLEVSQDVEVITEENYIDEEDTYEEDMEITHESFVGDWQPWSYDEDEFFGLVDIYADYSVEVILQIGTYDDAEWTGNLSFKSDKVATLNIEQDGRPGIITFTAKGDSIDVDIEIEEISDEDDYSPYSGKIHLNIPMNPNMTYEMRAEIN